MSGKSINILLIEDDPADAALIREALSTSSSNAHMQFNIDWVRQLDEGLKLLRVNEIDLVLLDLSLPEVQGLEAFDRVVLATPELPLLLLCGSDDEALAQEAVNRGAQDYISKSRLDSHWLPRIVHFVIRRKTAEIEAKENEARFQVLSDACPLGVFVTDAGGCCAFTNASYQKMSGLACEESLGSNWYLAVHPEDRQRIHDEWMALLAIKEKEHLQTEFRFRRADQSVVWVRANAAAIRDGTNLFGYVTTLEDISERKEAMTAMRQAEDELYSEKVRVKTILNSIGDAVLTTNIQGDVTYLNAAAEKLTGWTLDDAWGHPLSEVFNAVDGETRQPVPSPALIALRENKAAELMMNAVLVRRDGSESGVADSACPIRDQTGKVSGAVLVFRDVSETRGMALKMAYQAQHDPLTDLPNRTLLHDRLAQAIVLARRHQRKVALLYMDLDHFKYINDSLGHTVGDNLLKEVTERLLTCVRVSDTVSRQGGDEFVVLLAEVEETQDAAICAEKMINALAVPINIDGNLLYVSLSIGIGIYPDNGSDAETLIRNADTAMYFAKESGRANYQFFTQEMNDRAVERQSLEVSLRRAVARHEFILHYQPKINIGTGAITGVEALIRWRHPEGRLIHPTQFIPIAEACGLILNIGKWVLREACRQAQAWLQAGLAIERVAVNISALEFRANNFLEGVRSALDDSGLKPCHLEVELTESSLMHDTEKSKSLLHELKRMGVSISIDDFGTGYSSLSYLKRYPIDTLKIDQSFVRCMIGDTADAAIVSAIIGMGKNLNYRVVAEGVETQEQHEFLQSHLCDEIQGFHFSRPLCAEELEKLLQSRVENSKGSSTHQLQKACALLEGKVFVGQRKRSRLHDQAH